MNNKTSLFFVALLMGVSVIVQAKEFIITENDRQFQIDQKEVTSLNIRAGDTVTFVNEDKFLHTVFSTSEAKKFKLARSSNGESHSVTFDKKGTVEVECKIHNSMYVEINVK